MKYLTVFLPLYGYKDNFWTFFFLPLLKAVYYKMSDQRNIWDQKHQKYNNSDWVEEPTIFAQEVIEYIAKASKLLELGAGNGQDTRYFAKNNVTVVATDFSETALSFNKNKLPDAYNENVKFELLDLNSDFDFPDEMFDVVYSHLSIHYFSKARTKKIFDEIHRVLKPNGIVAILVNSTDDPEYSMPNKNELEKDFFEFDYGLIKRFFSVDSIKEFTAKFKVILLDNKGETLKDKALGVHNLVRFIGKK